MLASWQYFDLIERATRDSFVLGKGTTWLKSQVLNASIRFSTHGSARAKPLRATPFAARLQLVVGGVLPIQSAS